MKCKILNCDEEASAGFACCSALHGMMFNNAREAMRDIATANTRKHGLLTWSWNFENDPTIEEYEYYLSL